MQNFVSSSFEADSERARNRERVPIAATKLLAPVDGLNTSSTREGNVTILSTSWHAALKAQAFEVWSLENLVRDPLSLYNAGDLGFE